MTLTQQFVRHFASFVPAEILLQLCNGKVSLQCCVLSQNNISDPAGLVAPESYFPFSFWATRNKVSNYCFTLSLRNNWN